MSLVFKGHLIQQDTVAMTIMHECMNDTRRSLYRNKGMYQSNYNALKMIKIKKFMNWLKPDILV